MKKVLAVTALVGVAGAATIADAAPSPATLVSVTNYSNNGSGSFNLSLSTATWTFDTATGEAVITGGTYYGEVLSPNVYGHTMNGVTLGNFSPTIGTWSCQEGTFGGAVGASICGNYNFGSNKINESTYTPSAQGATVTIGGDDATLGAAQTLQTSYSTMTTTSLGGDQYILSNAAFPGSTASKAGYDFLFELAPVVPDDTVPDAFSFTDQTGVALSTPITSNAITVAGINVPVAITAVGATTEYSIDGGAFTNAAGTVSAGQTVAVRVTSADTPATATPSGVVIGGVAGAFNVTTEAADTTPDAFSFTEQTDVQINTQLTSNAVSVGGINTPVAITVVGGEYSINDGGFTSADGTVSNGDTVAVRQTSAAAFDTATTATVTIGGVPGTFTVTTGDGQDQVLVIDGGSSALDPWSLGFLAGLPLLRRRRKAALKLAAAATVAATSVLAAPNASAASTDDRWDWNYDGLYLGAGINGTSLETSDSFNAAIADVLGPVDGGGNFEDSVVGGQVYAGWMFSRYWGLEGRWSGTDDGESDILLRNTAGDQTKVGDIEASIDGWTAYAVGNWPVAQRWDLFGKVGYTWQNADYTITDTISTGGSVSGDESDDGVAAALGARWRFARHWATSVEGEFLGVDFEDNFDEPWRASLNVEYWFGGSEIAPPPPPPAKVVAAPPPPPPAAPLDSDGDGVVDGTDQCPETPRGDRVGPMGCSCDVTRQLQFAFDSAKLTDADKLILDEMAENLTRLKFISGTIEGHTDSVGSEAYNQGLSERRAEAVADYLGTKGIARDRLLVVGRGELDPIADNKTAEGRAQNRRVVAKRTDCDK